MKVDLKQIKPTERQTQQIDFCYATLVSEPMGDYFKHTVEDCHAGTYCCGSFSFIVDSNGNLIRMTQNHFSIEYSWSEYTSEYYRGWEAIEWLGSSYSELFETFGLSPHRVLDESNLVSGMLKKYFKDPEEHAKGTVEYVTEYMIDKDINYTASPSEDDWVTFTFTIDRYWDDLDQTDTLTIQVQYLSQFVPGRVLSMSETVDGELKEICSFAEAETALHVYLSYYEQLDIFGIDDPKVVDTDDPKVVDIDDHMDQLENAMTIWTSEQPLSWPHVNQEDLSETQREYTEAWLARKPTLEQFK